MDIWMCYRCGEVPSSGARDTESPPVDDCVCGGEWKVYDILDSEIEEMGLQDYADDPDEADLDGVWYEDTH